VKLSVKNKGFKYGFCKSFSVNYFIFDCSDCSHYEYHVFFLDRTGRLQSLFVFYDIASYTATDIITLGSAPTSSGTQLGSVIVAGTSVSGFFASGTTNIWLLTIPYSGIYLFNFSCFFDGYGSAVTGSTITLSGANVPATTTKFSGTYAMTSGQIFMTGSCVINCTASNYYLTNLVWNGGATNVLLNINASFFQATRIG
jgi:hypothetical protein